MATDREQIESIKAQALQQLADLRANPKPSYSIDGQNVAWDAYLASLERTVDWCDRKLAGYEPYEIASRGCS